MAGVDNRDPGDDYKHLLAELKLYDPALQKKPRLVAANKMDLPAAAANLRRFRRKHKVDVLEISCLDETGLTELRLELLRRVRSGGSPAEKTAAPRKAAKAKPVRAKPAARKPALRAAKTKSRKTG